MKRRVDACQLRLGTLISDCSFVHVSTLHPSQVARVYFGDVSVIFAALDRVGNYRMLTSEF